MRWLLVLACAGCSFEVRSMAGDGADTGGGTPARVRAIDIVDARVIDGPHASFPLLITISEPWLRATANGGDVARVDGFDISFSLEPTGERLDHEIESYVPATGALVAWVRFPALASSSIIYVRYGDAAVTTSQENPAGVWSAGYAAVWHLSNVDDSTAHNSGAIESGPILSGGQIAGSRRFDAVDDYIDIGNNAAIDNIFAAGGTVEAWIHPTGWGEGDAGRIIDKQAPNGWTLVVGPSYLAFLHTSVGVSGYWSAGGLALGSFQYVAMTYDKTSPANDPTFYMGGDPVIAGRIAPTGSLHSDAMVRGIIGNNSTQVRTFDGSIDELRLSTVARTPGWIATTFANEMDPAGFYSLGPELSTAP